MGNRFSDVSWYCDRCNASLDAQTGFTDLYQTWTCTECGYVNTISEDNIVSDEELSYEELQIPRRTAAADQRIINRDSDSALIHIRYICPHCSCPSGGTVLVGKSNLDIIDGSWETDQVCDACGGNVIVECR